MGELAVPALDSEMSAANYDIMRAGCMAVPALGDTNQIPNIVALNFRIFAKIAHIFNPWNKNTSSTAIIACYLSLVRHSFDDLICHLFAVVAISAMSHEDELGSHN